jgi:hypothetical protein
MEARSLEIAVPEADLPSFARHLPLTRTAIPFARHLHRTHGAPLMRRRSSFIPWRSPRCFTTAELPTL